MFCCWQLFQRCSWKENKFSYVSQSTFLPFFATHSHNKAPCFDFCTNITKPPRQNARSHHTNTIALAYQHRQSGHHYQAPLLCTCARSKYLHFSLRIVSGPCYLDTKIDGSLYTHRQNFYYPYASGQICCDAVSLFRSSFKKKTM